jgi:DME family drug/metabolite transporter
MSTDRTSRASRRNGRRLVAVSALLWSTTGLAGVLAPKETTAAALGEARTLVGGLALALFVVTRAGFRPIVRAAGWPLLIASIALAVFQWAFFVGVRGAGSAVAAIVSAGVSPFAGDLLEATRARGHHRAGLIAGLLLMAAAVLVLRDEGVRSGAPMIGGLVAAAASGFAYAIYADVAASQGRTAVELSKSGRAPDPEAPVALTALALLGAALALVPAAASGLPGLVSVPGVTATAYLGLIATALPYFLFVRGLRHVTAADALAVLILQPLSAAAIGWVALGERIEGPAAIATLVLLVATALRSFRSSVINATRPEEKTP